MRRAGRLAIIAAAVLATGCSAGDVGSGATEPGDPAGQVDSAVPVQPDGFERTSARVTKADGTICALCVWRAESADQRRRGLMFVTDLGPADAMTFDYGGPHTGRFWMKNTVLPLSIAFFDPEGVFMSSFDMEPCVTETCQRYRTPTDFVVAIEVEQGRLGDFGLIEGSRLELLDVPCDDPAN